MLVHFALYFINKVWSEVMIEVGGGEINLFSYMSKSSVLLPVLFSLGNRNQNYKLEDNCSSLARCVGEGRVDQKLQATLANCLICNNAFTVAV